MKKDLTSVKNFSVQEIKNLFALTAKMKKSKKKFADALKGKTICLIFHKPSLRTRVSFEVAMTQMGGNAIDLKEDIGLGQRETIKDAAMTLSRFADGIVVRTFAHENVLELARHASIPVINGLSDLSHPCQALADFYTVLEKRGTLKGVTFAYVGDGNNVCHSLMFCAAKLGVTMRIATPKGYEPLASVVEGALICAKETGAVISIMNDPAEAVKNADVIYTDVWASMGQESEALERKKIFASYQVNAALVAKAKKDVLIMHCLPAHRGEEITSDVIDSGNSIVFDEAENRLHVQKAILFTLLGEK